MLDPRAEIEWTRSWSAVRVRQTVGGVFYRAEPGGTFDVATGAGQIRVTGTCFRVMSGLGHRCPGTERAPTRPLDDRAGLRRAGPGRSRLNDGRGPSGRALHVRVRGPGAALGRPGATGSPCARASNPNARVAMLESELASLRRSLAELRARQPAGDPSDASLAGIGWVDLTQRELQMLARRCDLRYDMSMATWDISPHISNRVATEFRLTVEERAALDKILREDSARYVEQMRKLYVEVTGNREAAQQLSPFALHQEVLQKVRAGRGRRHSRADGANAPARSRRPSTRPGVPAERLIRLLAGLSRTNGRPGWQASWETSAPASSPQRGRLRPVANRGLSREGKHLRDALTTSSSRRALHAQDDSLVGSASPVDSPSITSFFKRTTPTPRRHWPGPRRGL